MAIAERGDDDAYWAFGRAGGRFSNELFDQNGRTDAFYVPLKQIDTFLKLDGTFLDKNGKYLKDKNGNFVYEVHLEKPEVYKAAIEAAVRRRTILGHTPPRVLIPG